MMFSTQGLREYARIILNTSPAARATVRGDEEHRRLHGAVSFYPVKGGTLVAAEIYGLPNKPVDGVFGFHIHEGTACKGTKEDPFSMTGGHYNPTKAPHPLHAGDMPPLFGNDGYAYMSFFTNRFTVEEIIGRTVIIHNGPDDFTTQPSGASGKKIACGEIKKRQ
jgi:Cu-Zn family superoxide dismutase